jgi:anaerobic selenocysteine-containing dehydrogenase
MKNTVGGTAALRQMGISPSLQALYAKKIYKLNLAIYKRQFQSRLSVNVALLIACRRRGGQVIIINPVKEKGLVNFTLPSDWRSMLGGGSEVASVYLQANIGADIAVLKGIAKACLAQNGQQQDFINNYTEGFAAYAADIENTSWHSISKQSGLDQATLEKVAELYLTAKKAVFAWGMGITQHLHGVDNVESIVNLALLRGMIGQTGAGLLPLRGFCWCHPSTKNSSFAKY